MTREDIEIEACLYEDGCHNPSVQKHFKDGAEWAKQELIDKACEWLRSRIDYDNTGRSCRVFFMDSIELFRKAMEE